MPKSIKYLEEYDEKDFLLPDEVLPDGRLTYHEQCVLASQKQCIKAAARDLKQTSRLTKTIDGLYQSSFLSTESEKNERLNRNGASTNVMGRKAARTTSKDRAIKEHAAEMALIRAVVGKNPGKAQELSRMRPEDFGDVSTLDYPRLNSLEEAQEDLRLEALEAYYNSHGTNKAAVTWSVADKRMLRKWFKALDFDGSGEVSVQELQDPLISAGILKTRDQVFRVLLNADKNGTMGLDFKEFLDALHGNELANVAQLVELQRIGADSSGLNMDTMVCAERRKKLINSIVDQNEKRGFLFDKSFKTLAQTAISGGARFGRANAALGQIEDQQVYERLLHNKYVDSLECVVLAKKAEQVQRDNVMLDQSYRAREGSSRPQATFIISGASSPQSPGGGTKLSPWEELQLQQHQQKKATGIDLAKNPWACFNSKTDPWAKRRGKGK